MKLGEAEIERWREAIAEGRLFVAEAATDGVVGFASSGRVDDAPYLDQLSVFPSHMRRGIGRALLERVIDEARTEPLWLTTYAHLPWNQPYYERLGFHIVPETEHAAELRRILEEQRAALPAPERRVAMRAARRIRVEDSGPPLTGTTIRSRVAHVESISCWSR